MGQLVCCDTVSATKDIKKLQDDLPSQAERIRKVKLPTPLLIQVLPLDLMLANAEWT
jgi:hypothetical protein